MKWNHDQAAKDILEIICEPARRHQCEFCKAVFICHLCTIRFTHMLHLIARNQKGIRYWNHPRNWYYACKECIAKRESPFVRTRNGLYNELTGECVKVAKRRIYEPAGTGKI